MTIRTIAITLTMLATTAIATAQTTVVTTTTREPLTLSPTQRTTIYRSIEQRPVTSGTATVEYRVGMRVPQTVELYEVPQTVVTEVPAVRSYKYMAINGRVWLVDPATSEIVAEVAQ